MRMFELSEARHTWTFTGITSRPVPSLNRGFAAPIYLDLKQSDSDLALLARADSDAFNRYEAMNRLMMSALLTQVRSLLVTKQTTEVSSVLIEAFGTLLKDSTLSPAFKAEAMTLPSERSIADQMPVVDPDAIHQAREYLRKVLAVRSLTTLQSLVDSMQTLGAYSPDPESAGKRALKNACHGYLIASGSKHPIIAIRDQLLKAENLTDKLAALTLLSHSDTPTKNDLSVQALQEWINEPLLVNKWLTIQATSPCFDDETPVVERLKQLVRCKFFSITNPNNVYALLLAFFVNNPSEFHRLDGTGYQFWADVVLELDKHNPHVAARIARCLENWRRYTPERANAMFHQLKFMESRQETLSDSVNEIITKALHNPV
ncbi:aminopeptidase N [gut metagenome]|uniref:Aminopeptidase N n=1 Tax=gut metagenome TaxID=749906 RepID=J9FI85_9ZZZZ